jgi:serine/threonine protein kinase
MKPKAIIMRHYPHGALSDLIRKRPDAPSITENDWNGTLILSFMKDIAGGIAAVHQAGFAHNDIKVLFINASDIPVVEYAD